MDYSPYQKGKSTKKQPITIETPVYEWDQATTEGSTYLRYEKADEIQYIERVIHDSGSYEKTYALWSDRDNPANVWTPLAFDKTLYDSI